MNTARILLTLLVIVLSCLVGLVAYHWVILYQPANLGGAPVRCEIPPGANVDQVHRLLIEYKVIRPGTLWTYWVRLRGEDRKIQAGRYDLSPAMSPVAILSTLIQGRGVLSAVTIPEGWAQTATFERLSAELEIPFSDFEIVANDQSWLKTMQIPASGLEGYLYPETYHFASGLSARTILETMINLGREQASPVALAAANELGLNWHQTLTLASIIEAEAARPEERAQIAAVYHNRLRAGWLLQADPTVAFAAGVNGTQLTRRDLALDSPYNTYVYKGLPPGPICSPGAECIAAALAPLPDCGDYYFVARGDGSHIFSRTLSEHNRAKRQVER
jgi:peptidoglycan lytic transglycosylase G